MNIEQPLIDSYYLDPLELASHYENGVRYMAIKYGDTFDTIEAIPITESNGHEHEHIIQIYEGGDFLFITKINRKPINYNVMLWREDRERDLAGIMRNKRKMKLKSNKEHLRNCHAIINYIGVTPMYYDRTAAMGNKIRMKFRVDTLETRIALNNLKTMSDERFMQVFGFEKSNIYFTNWFTIYVKDFLPQI